MNMRHGKYALLWRFFTLKLHTKKIVYFLRRKSGFLETLRE